ncbi:ABC transporter permease [Rugosimonospora africana]|uniref:Peptide ABC transporter n=1 Tax=Rugosimonospora africana TaxID=556532 RepID=A0A8J3R3H3_9ACTN|nr:ABC transporter permease [Rugosimonospora africana]GIH21202.1 peptide ABC transporter [Rugosimonospora africana]
MITRRLLMTIPILVGTAVIVFLILRLVPGDPASAILGANATPAGIRQVRADLGLNRPLWAQFGSWVSGVVRGDFGHDYITNQSITAELGARLPVTLELAGIAFVLAAVVAIPAGVLAAVRQGGIVAKVVQGLSVLTIAVPDFVFGILGILLFALTLGLAPSSGYVAVSTSLGDNLRSLILPAIALALGLGGVLARVTRSAMLEVLHTDYVRFARAGGMSPVSIVFGRALRNAAIPIVTVAGLQVGYLLGGTIVVEQLFAIPGVGQLIVQAMLNRNYPVVQACVLIFVVGFILVNLISDLLYTVLNPKLRRAGA